MDAIQNVNEYKQQDKYYIAQRYKEYELDFLYSNKLNDIESGIKETLKGVNTANLAIALAIAKIDIEALYIQAGYKSYMEYLTQAEDRLNMPKQTISDYKRIGEIYLRYKRKLESVGFEIEGQLHKLRFLEQALHRHNEEEVYKKLVSVSLRQFKSYALADPSERSDESVEVGIAITDQGIMINGKLQIALKEIKKIVESGNEPIIIGVYDRGEKRAIQGFLKRYRAKK